MQRMIEFNLIRLPLGQGSRTEKLVHDFLKQVFGFTTAKLQAEPVTAEADPATEAPAESEAAAEVDSTVERIEIEIDGLTASLTPGKTINPRIQDLAAELHRLIIQDMEPFLSLEFRPDVLTLTRDDGETRKAEIERPHKIWQIDRKAELSLVHDAEAAYEREGAAETLSEWLLFLKSEGVDFSVQAPDSETLGPAGAAVIIDGERYDLFLNDEPQEKAWALTSIRLVGIVNSRLRDAGSSYRLTFDDENIVFSTFQYPDKLYYWEDVRPGAKIKSEAQEAE